MKMSKNEQDIYDRDVERKLSIGLAAVISILAVFILLIKLGGGL